MRELRSVKQWVLDYEKAAQFVEELEVLYEFHKAGEVDETELKSLWDVTIAHFEDLEFKNILVVSLTSSDSPFQVI